MVEVYERRPVFTDAQRTSRCRSGKLRTSSMQAVMARASGDGCAEAEGLMTNMGGEEGRTDVQVGVLSTRGLRAGRRLGMVGVNRRPQGRRLSTTELFSIAYRSAIATSLVTTAET